MKIDRLEFWVRFACGALFGLILGLYLTLHLFGGPPVLPLGITLTIGLGFAVGAVRYGDRFWERILGVLQSWLPWL